MKKVFLISVSILFPFISYSEPCNDIDILWIVDNSVSMTSEQEKAAHASLSLLNSIKNLDWRIAATSTDTKDFSRLKGWFKRGDYPNPSQEKDSLSQLLNIGIDSDAVLERPIANTIGVLTKNPQNFLRNNAYLAVVFLTDEDNCSDGAGCQNSIDTPSELLKIARQTKGDRFRFYGIYWIPNTPLPTDVNGTTYQAKTLQTLVDHTFGIERSIWSYDYSDVFENIGKNIVEFVNP